MTNKQKRAIWYAERARKLITIENMGLLAEYNAFTAGCKNHKIARFESLKGVRF